MSLLDTLQPAELARFKTAFKVSAKKKVVGASQKEQEDQNLLKEAKKLGVDNMKIKLAGKERILKSLITQAALEAGHQQSMEKTLAAEKKADDYEKHVESQRKALKMLEYDIKQWTEIESKWKTSLAAEVPTERVGEVNELKAEGNKALTAKKSLKEMRRIAKALTVALALKDSDENYKKIFDDNGKDWFKVKTKYVEGEIGKDKMTELWNYRQKITDKMLADMKAQYKFEYAAVGSTDLTSDIDVGISSHGEGEDGTLFADWQIVNKFNELFKAKFGQEPGVYFDVNLYASAPKAVVAADLDDDNPAKKSMQAMTNAGQDVGALIKQRRYMSVDEFDKYQEAIVAPYKKKLETATEGEQKELKELIDVTAKQFSEADSLYQLSLRRSLDKAVAVLKKKEKELEANKESDEYKNAKKKLDEFATFLEEIDGSNFDLEKGQKKLIKAIEEMEHDLDLSMAVNNEIYTEAVEEVRRLEVKLAELQEVEKDLKQKIEAKDPVPPEEEANRLKQELKKLQDDNAAAGLTARISDLYADAVLFANEAYLSDGPMKHIVDAAQGAKFQLEAGQVEGVSAFDWETMTKEQQDAKLKEVQKARRDGITIHEALQSFNEQFGDMLKDLNHYKSKPPGFAFYRASKYLGRLIDAIDLIKGKLTMIDWDGTLSQGGLTQSLATLAAGVGTLVSVRKGEGDKFIDNAKQYDPVKEDMPDVAKLKVENKEKALQAYCVKKMTELFGTGDVDGLKALVNGLSQKINIVCREQIAKEMKASNDSAYFKSVGKNDKGPEGKKVTGK